MISGWSDSTTEDWFCCFIDSSTMGQYLILFWGINIHQSLRFLGVLWIPSGLYPVNVYSLRTGKWPHRNSGHLPINDCDVP
jgi:hypothetical protein